jgi:hypothetical protein
VTPFGVRQRDQVTAGDHVDALVQALANDSRLEVGREDPVVGADQDVDRHAGPALEPHSCSNTGSGWSRRLDSPSHWTSSGTSRGKQVARSNAVLPL